ncbi:4Fe-4S dicluster domain-containing protein [Adlercreutzia shanghongiae]|uniref:4Fe-4S dicluster domain-containing protein n=1 Tax=Adlercreutzia shanghongiae TaxID=3111773 RepID=A0ABU6IY39_9ACTN|nr:4Fe-4S dicluster domain-containing protein [Adlercreutzia sp. R22]MEC4294765.1 4Fe-4S dicluster domain-containing protein [Adlercreutzia sp. R22]
MDETTEKDTELSQDEQAEAAQEADQSTDGAAAEQEPAPYEGPVRYGFVIDTWFCVGCQSCAIACKIENNVPDGVRWNKVMNLGGGNMNTPTGVYPDLTRGYYTLACQHCENPACVASCPTGASSKDPETGIVTMAYEDCIGCQSCIQACPYEGVRTYIDGEPPYSVEMAIGDKDIQPHVANVVEKCTMCVHRVGRGEQPACVDACKNYARHWGNLEDPNSEVSQLLATREYYQLQPEDGTEPNVYYLKPLR